MKIELIVSCGQYEKASTQITINCTTFRGLHRRIKQLKTKYRVHGDNWTGWIPATVAIASSDDTWGDNNVIGEQWCEPALGWIGDKRERGDMSYEELQEYWLKINEEEV